MTYLAVAISATDTETALAAMRQAVGLADLAELRLDLMPSFDLERLLEERPLPVIATCRAEREGGRWQGSEAQRLALLRRATQLGVDYVDLEWDAVRHADALDLSRTRLILSRHDFQGMPDLRKLADQLRSAEPNVVKVVGTAQRLVDSLPALQLLEAAVAPTIAIAMGRSGILTRVMAFRYRQAFLSFAAPDAPLVDQKAAPLLDGRIGSRISSYPTTPSEADSVQGSEPKGTAPGQVTVSAMRNLYRVQAIDEKTRVIGWLGNEAQVPGPWVAGNAWLARHQHNAIMVPLHLAETEELAHSLAALAQVLPLVGCLLAPDNASSFLRALVLTPGQQQSVASMAAGLHWILDRT